MDVKYRFNGYTVDPVRRLLFGPDAQPIALKPRVFDTLLYLIEHRGELLEKQTLLDAVWPNVVVEENNLNQAVSTLRRVFGEKRDEHRFIVTEPGRGYRFVAEVETVRGPQAALAPAHTPEGPARLSNRRRTGALWGSVVAVATAAGVVAWLQLEPPAGPGAGAPLAMLVRDAPLTAYAGNEVEPALSPDGASVVFSRDDGGNRDLYVARIGGSGAAQLTASPEPDRFPAWSPNGAEIAFLRQLGPNAFDVIVMPAIGGHERRITTVYLRPIQVFASSPLAWTPRSDGLVFTTRTGDDQAAAHHVYRLTLAPPDLVPLTAGEDVYDTSPAISPDGRWLAFVRHPAHQAHLRGSLLVMPLDANAEEREPLVVPVSAPEETIGDAVHSPVWSADSRYLTFVAGTQLLEWELGAATSRLVYAGAGYFGGITLAGDVSSLAMVRDGERARAVVAAIRSSADIFALPLSAASHEATAPPTARIASSAGDGHPDISPDGQRIAFISRHEGRSDIWSAAADGSDLVRLTNMSSRIVGYPRWSPDSSRIAFHADVDNQREVFVIAPDGSGLQRIGAGCCVDWSPDGEYVYAMIIGEVYTLARIRLDDGKREPLFTGSFPTLATDGSKLLYGKQAEQNIYARAVAGDLRSNEEEILVTDAAYPAGIAPTTDGFFYLGHTAERRSPPLRFYDYATREARTITRLPGRSHEILSISPDGSELLYGAQAESAADLVLLEFGEPWR